MADAKYWRDLTLAETRVKLAEVQATFDTEEGDIEDYLNTITEQQKQKMLRDVGNIITSGNVAAVAGLSLLGLAMLSNKLRDTATSVLEKGKKAAANEIKGAIPTTTNFTKNVIRSKVDLLVDNRRQAIENAVKARTIDLMNNEIGRTAAVADIEKLFDQEALAANNEISGSVVVDSYNEGRALAFDHNPEQIHGLQRSEILDDKTCAMCMSIDGRVLSQNDPFTNVGEIHTNCRGIWVAIIKTDAELPNIGELPKSIRSRFDTVEGMPTKNAFNQLKQPIVRKGSRLEQAIKDGKVQTP